MRIHNIIVMRVTIGIIIVTITEAIGVLKKPKYKIIRGMQSPCISLYLDPDVYKILLLIIVRRRLRRLQIRKILLLYLLQPDHYIP